MVIFTVKNKSDRVKVEIEKSEGILVGDVKSAIAEKLDIPMGEQRLILKGKVLTDNDSIVDPNTLASQAVHLVRSTATSEKAKPTATTPKPIQVNEQPFGGDMSSVMDMVSNMMSKNSGSALKDFAGLLHDPDAKESLQEATRAAQEQLSAPGAMDSLFKSADFQSVMSGMIGREMPAELEKAIAGIGGQTGENVISDLLSRPDFMDNLPQIFDKSIDVVRNLKSKDSTNVQDSMKKLMETPGLGDLVDNVFGQLSASGFSGLDGGEISSKAPPATTTPTIASLDLQGVSEQSVTTLSELGFRDHSKNISLLLKHEGSVDKVIAELLQQ
eukprot:GHVH01000214.1.p1 GENE.GHVH01000214.1~~GHVH01000214.1.p1  ORF type:complete len:346 (+),score=65.86 GHVH01000214.1:53-1039(+)